MKYETKPTILAPPIPAKMSTKKTLQKQAANQSTWASLPEGKENSVAPIPHSSFSNRTFFKVYTVFLKPVFVLYMKKSSE